MQCEVCGNEYSHAFTIVRDEERFVFDCFECAIHALAPTCANCGCKIVGHGVDHDEEIFCCNHCLRMAAGDVDDEDEDEDEEDDDVDFEVDEAGADEDEDDDEDELAVDFEDEDSEDLQSGSRTAGGRGRH